MKKLLIVIFSVLSLNLPLITCFSDTNYVQAVIKTDEAVELGKSNIFDASQSFISDPSKKMTYRWDFGDGNSNEGVEVLHAYKKPGKYTIKLTISDKSQTSETGMEIFVYRKAILLITDQTEAEARIEDLKSYAEKKGVYIKVIESFGSATEFISEEILAKKLTENTSTVQKAQQILVWTKENAGLNALSRYIQSNIKKTPINLTQKLVIVLEDDIKSTSSRIQRQFEIINSKSIIVSKEAIIYPLIENVDESKFIETLEKGGYEYKIIDKKTGRLRPWNFMSYFVNLLINEGVPDNTIALLLLLPVIATVVVFMKQIIGITTFGIYTPSIITLSFLIIGLPTGLLILLTAILIGAITLPLLGKVRMLFIPKMSIVITTVSLILLLILILSNQWGMFNAEYLSLAIFPMLILSTLVEKFISVKTEKGFSTAVMLMSETVLVAIIAYFIAGGEINLLFAEFKFALIKNILITYPEIIFLFLAINIILGKWTGLRLLEQIRFREVLRHIEE
jgi:PKD repeat protein